MSEIDLRSRICEAVDTIVEERMKDHQGDYTITCEIIEHLDESVGLYKVKYQNSYFDAYAFDGAIYNPGINVDVVVPNGDFSGTKKISGASNIASPIHKLSRVDDFDAIYQTSENALEGISEKILGNAVNRYEENLFSNIEYNIPINYALKDEDYFVLEADITPENIGNLEGKFDFGIEIELDVFKNYTFSDVFNEDFYITEYNQNEYNSVFGYTEAELAIMAADEATKPQYDEIMAKRAIMLKTYFYETKKYVLSIEDFKDNPFLWEDNKSKKVRKIFDISMESTYRLKSAKVFLTRNNEIAENYNIAFSNFKLYTAIKYDDDVFNNYLLRITSNQYKYYNGDKSGSLDLNLEFLIKGLNINFNISSTPYQIYWFQEDASVGLGSEDYSTYGGIGWKCLNSKSATGDNTFIWNSAAPAISIPLKDLGIKERFKVVLIYGDEVRKIVDKAFYSFENINYRTEKGNCTYGLFCYNNDSSFTEGNKVNTFMTLMTNDKLEFQDNFFLKVRKADESIIYQTYWTKSDSAGSYSSIDSDIYSDVLGITTKDVNDFTYFVCTVKDSLGNNILTDNIKITNASNDSDSTVVIRNSVSDDKMDKVNPVGSGSFNFNAADGYELGASAIAMGYKGIVNTSTRGNMKSLEDGSDDLISFNNGYDWYTALVTFTDSCLLSDYQYTLVYRDNTLLGKIFFKSLTEDPLVYTFSNPNKITFSTSATYRLENYSLCGPAATEVGSVAFNMGHSTALGSFSSGIFTQANGEGSTAYGIGTVANEKGSFVEGFVNLVDSEYSHAEGYKTKVLKNSYNYGSAAHAEGYSTTASNTGAHAEGVYTIASGYAAHAEGQSTKASGDSAHAEGISTEANGYASHAEGTNTRVRNSYGHAEGSITIANGCGHAEGEYTGAFGDYLTDFAYSSYGHAEGQRTAAGLRAHAEGYGTLAFTQGSHSEGTYTHAVGQDCHVEGWGSVAAGNTNHAEGYETFALFSGAHAEGYETTAFGGHAEGQCTIASWQSHSEGNYTIAKGSSSHSEGDGSSWSYYNTANISLTITSITKTSISFTISEDNEAFTAGNFIIFNNDNCLRAIISSKNNLSCSCDGELWYYRYGLDIFNGEPNLDRIHQLNWQVGDIITSSGYKIIDCSKSTCAYGNGAHAEGDKTQAIGHYSHAEGAYTNAKGLNSHTEGINTIAYSDNDHAEGYASYASGGASHAEGGSSNNSSNILAMINGKKNILATLVSYTEGMAYEGHFETTTKVSNYEYYDLIWPTSSGGDPGRTWTQVQIQNVIFENDIYSFTIRVSISYGANPRPTSAYEIGTVVTLPGTYSKSEIDATAKGAKGSYSHVEGYDCDASNYCSHAEGYQTISSGFDGSHAEGANTIASGYYAAHAEGGYTIASGMTSHAEGYSTEAASNYQHVQGKYNIVDDNNIYADIIGNGTADDARSNAWTVDWDGNAVAAGDITAGSDIISTDDVISGRDFIGTGCISINRKAETTVGVRSTTEGINCEASGANSHAEGDRTTASNESAHAEGQSTTASNYYTHAEGHSTTASGLGSHAEGFNTTSSNNQSHAEGAYTTASGLQSHAEGLGTTAVGNCQHVQGKYNISDTNGDYADIVGGGTENTPKNIETLDWSGNLWVAGDVTGQETSGGTTRTHVLSNKADKATTLSGYGITDASINSSTNEITLGNNTITPVVASDLGDLATIDIDGASSTKFLKGDGTWANVGGGSGAGLVPTTLWEQTVQTNQTLTNLTDYLDGLITDYDFFEICYYGDSLGAPYQDINTTGLIPIMMPDPQTVANPTFSTKLISSARNGRTHYRAFSIDYSSSVQDDPTKTKFTISNDFYFATYGASSPTRVESSTTILIPFKIIGFKIFTIT